MESLSMPGLDYLLDDSPCEPYPYDKTFEEARNHPVMVIQAMGSSRLPKPVVWSNWTLTTGDARYLVHSLDTRPIIWGGIYEACARAYMALPIYHGAGIGIAISAACLGQTIIVLGPPGQESADTLGTMLESADIDVINIVPGILEDVATRPDILSKLDKLKFAAVVGGGEYGFGMVLTVR
jgi:acyl-CoA synthetase (AMP-forming)/AMP-acid ligase II